MKLWVVKACSDHMNFRIHFPDALPAFLTRVFLPTPASFIIFLQLFGAATDWKCSSTTAFSMRIALRLVMW